MPVPRRRLPYARTPISFLGLRDLGRRCMEQQTGFWNNQEDEMLLDDFGVLVNPRGQGFEVDHRGVGDGDDERD